jgi:hypothetical protein
MGTQDKYKIEVRWDAWTDRTAKLEVIPLPVDKVTNIRWDSLVKVIAENGVAIADEIRLNNVGQMGGTRMLNRKELLSLWKQVEAHRIKNPPNQAT